MPVPKAIKKNYITKKQLLEILKKEGFFSNTQSFWVYEKKGIIKKPAKSYTMKNGWEVGLYTKKEVDDIVTAIKLLPVKKRISARSI